MSAMAQSRSLSLRLNSLTIYFLFLSSAVIPAIVIASVNAWNLWNEHWEHMAHEPPRSEQPEYPYQNIRTKNFFWGDGDKVGDALSLLCFVDVYCLKLTIACVDPLLERQRQLPQEGMSVLNYFLFLRS